MAVAWLARRRLVRSASLGPDGTTVAIAFRDGSRLAILPRAVGTVGIGQGANGALHGLMRSGLDNASGRALVLEPFANLLGHESTYGQVEADVLTRAGFRTDVLRNQQVTVASLETMADYSMVYMETHSGVLPDGDAVIAVNETNAGKYAALFDDGSVMQVTVAGGGATLYLAVKANFIKLHVGHFSDSSLLFLNGCAVTNAPKFWNALRSHNAGTLIGWDNEVASSDDEVAASYILRDLSQARTVSDSVADAIGHGLGLSTRFSTAHLGFLGDGDNTLAKVLAEATPTPVPTSTPQTTPTAQTTDTPTPRPVPRKKYFEIRVLLSLRPRVTGTLRIEVTNRSTGSVVKQARVVLNGKRAGGPSGRQTRTGRLGIATFAKLRFSRSGVVVLTVTKTGFVTGTKKFHV